MGKGVTYEDLGLDPSLDVSFPKWGLEPEGQCGEEKHLF